MAWAVGAISVLQWLSLDFNGDGLVNLVIGAPGVNNFRGNIYVIIGSQ